MIRLLCCQLCWLSAVCSLSVGQTFADDAKKAAVPKLPRYTIHRVRSKITIDGRLDEADWKQAKSVGKFKFEWWKKGMGKKEQTVCKMLWDIIVSLPLVSL